MKIRISLLLLLLGSLNLNLMANNMQTIEDVKKRHQSRLLATPGVVSVGIGLDEEKQPVIIVGVEDDDEALKASLPQQLEGYPVRVQHAGKIRAR